MPDENLPILSLSLTLSPSSLDHRCFAAIQSRTSARPRQTTAKSGITQTKRKSLRVESRTTRYLSHARNMAPVSDECD